MHAAATIQAHTKEASALQHRAVLHEKAVRAELAVARTDPTPRGDSTHLSISTNTATVAAMAVTDQQCRRMLSNSFYRETKKTANRHHVIKKYFSVGGVTDLTDDQMAEYCTRREKREEQKDEHVGADAAHGHGHD